MPRRLHNALSAAKVRTAGPGVYTDGNGLELRVDQHGRRWVHRVTVNGKRVNMGLGSFPTVSLKDARVLVLNNLQAIREGRNPLDEKRQRRSETLVPRTPTFQEFARSVHDVLKTKWTSERHATQWLESLRLHVFPHIGRRPIDQVTRQDVKAVIEEVPSKGV